LKSVLYVMCMMYPYFQLDLGLPFSRYCLLDAHARWGNPLEYLEWMKLVPQKLARDGYTLLYCENYISLTSTVFD